MDDFLSFRRMITPVLIQIVFWIGSAASLLFGLAALSRNEFAIALLFIFVGPLMIRIYCELLILFFRMNATLTEISSSVGSNAVGRSPTPASLASPSGTPPVRPAPRNQGAKPDWKTFG